jgi:putative SOS response-associated peptidase YedK
MCYYNGVKVSKDTLIELLEHEHEIKEIERSVQSGFEYNTWPIIKPIGKSDWKEEMAHWELIASWTKTMKDQLISREKFNTLNATCERLFESKVYKDAALKRRCLVLSSGFYEWRHQDKKTYPYYINVASESETPLFFMAGIYNTFTDKETGESFDSFSIVTTKANEIMEQIHNTKKRMPTILTKDLAEEWISEIPEQRIKEIAAYQYDSEEMVAYTVAKDFRTALNPLAEFHYEELEGLL